MKKYDIVAFDFDGTIADTKKGVLNSIKYALKNAGLSFNIDYKTCIGPTPKFLYSTIFNLPNDIANKCVMDHRYYGENIGFTECKLYRRVKSSLSVLKAHDIKIIIVSSKRKKVITKILNLKKIAYLFDEIYAIEDDESLSKKELLKRAISNNKRQSILFVGDTIYDYEASIANDIDFCYASYGYGEIKDKKTLVVTSFDELIGILI